MAPVHPLPPHCPYTVCPAPADAADVVCAAEEVVFVDATVVEAAVVLFTLLEVAVDPADAVDELAPPGTIALLVTVAVLLLCATELGNALYSVGPGMV